MEPPRNALGGRPEGNVEGYVEGYVVDVEGAPPHLSRRRRRRFSLRKQHAHKRSTGISLKALKKINKAQLDAEMRSFE